MRTNKAQLPKTAVIPKTGAGKKQRGYMHCYKASQEIYNGHRRVDATLYFTGWQDSKPVHLLSTFPVYATSIRRNAVIEGKYGKVDTPCPTCIPQYNKSMGGTDRHDQLTSYYNTSVSKKRWQSKILFHFLHASVVNAHILYKMEHKIERGMQNFRLIDFIQSICAAWKVHKPAEDRYTSHHTAEGYSYSVKTGSHTPYYWPGMRDPVTNKQPCVRRTCAECKKDGVQSGCMQCNRALCMCSLKGADPEASCWEKFHRRQRDSLNC